MSSGKRRHLRGLDSSYLPSTEVFQYFKSQYLWFCVNLNIVIQTAYNCSPYFVPDYLRVGRGNPRTMKRFTSVKCWWFWTIKCEELTCAVAEALERDPVLVAHVRAVCLHQTWNWTAWPFFFFNCWGLLNSAGDSIFMALVFSFPRAIL